MEPYRSRENGLPPFAVQALAVNHQHLVKPAPMTIGEEEVDPPERLLCAQAVKVELSLMAHSQQV